METAQGALTSPLPAKAIVEGLGGRVPHKPPSADIDSASSEYGRQGEGVLHVKIVKVFKSNEKGMVICTDIFESVQLSVSG